MRSRAWRMAKLFSSANTTAFFRSRLSGTGWVESGAAPNSGRVAPSDAARTKRMTGDFMEVRTIMESIQIDWCDATVTGCTDTTAGCDATVAGAATFFRSPAIL